MDISYEKTSYNFCPECGGLLIYVFERGDRVCSQCGLVVYERELDFYHSDKRAYNKQERNNRDQTGAPISNLTPNIGMSTVVSLSKITNSDLKRAAKWDTRMTWKERNLLIAITELKRMSTNLSLPDYIKETAIKLYKKACKKELIKGRSINAMITACIYYSCKVHKIPRTLTEIIEQSACKEKIVRGCYKVLINELKLKIPICNPITLLPKYSAKLNLSHEIEFEAIKLLDSMIKRNISLGKDPKGLCAGAIYFACKLKKQKLNQSIICKAIGVTEVTLRCRYKEIQKLYRINNLE